MLGHMEDIFLDRESMANLLATDLVFGGSFEHEVK